MESKRRQRHGRCSIETMEIVGRQTVRKEGGKELQDEKLEEFYWPRFLPRLFPWTKFNSGWKKGSSRAADGLT